MSSNRLRRQGRIAWKLVAGRRDADTLTGLNGDMAARAEVMHRFGVGRSTQGDQQAEGQSGTHPNHSVSNEPRSCAYERPRSQGAAASRPIKLAGSWGTPWMREEMSLMDAVDFAPGP
jgi:hypothetical protein